MRQSCYGQVYGTVSYTTISTDGVLDMSQWTTDDIPDQSGRVAIVTGGNSGIGYVTSLELARHGAHVIIAGRSPDNGRKAVADIKQKVPDSTVEWMKLDLSDLSSVRAFAEEYAAGHETLDLLINNAGVAFLPQGKTKDGFEIIMGTNHLGHFALTGLLLPKLLAKPDARVVTVASDIHEMPRAQLDLDDLMFERGYSRVTAYARSKLANLLFTMELHRRLTAAGRTQRSLAAQPGMTATNLGPRPPGNRVFRWLMGLIANTAAVGAAPTLYAATAPDARGGEYFQPSKRNGPPAKHQAKPYAYDEDTAARLWEMSEKLTNVSFDVGSTQR
jgi:NAD(P)-dependent dehydrogenase (short-subunit alcohol dehydrogenase family)